MITHGSIGNKAIHIQTTKHIFLGVLFFHIGISLIFIRKGVFFIYAKLFIKKIVTK